MGGIGSGRFFRLNKKATVENQHRIDIRYMNKQNCLIPGTLGRLSWSWNDKKTGAVEFEVKEDSLILYNCYEKSGIDKKNVEKVIYFDQTPCNYGGYRKWFLCPQCKRRVAVLYGIGSLFLCRCCNDLTYNSCNTHPTKRIYNNANKLRQKLGGNSGVINFIPDRPKGMHRSTYYKIFHEILRLENLGDLTLFEKWEKLSGCE